MSRRFKIILSLAAFFIVAIAAVVPAIFSVRAPITSLRIDPSTPAVQNGFTAIDVTTIGTNGQTRCHWPDTTPYLLRLLQKWRGIPSTARIEDGYAFGEDGGIALWVSPSWLPKVAPGASFPKNSYTCTGRSSSGSDVPMEWRQQVTGTGTMMLLCIPPGYPDTFRYVDVTLKDTAGHSAHWRVTGLPKMVHQVTPGTPKQAQFQFAGCTLRAQAWKQPGHEMGGGGVESKFGCVTRAWVKGHPTLPGNWEIEQHAPVAEWWPRGIPVPTTGYSTTAIDPGPGPNGISETSGTEDSLLYPDDTHWLRIPFVIHRYVYFDEVATFHDLPVRKIGAGYRICPARTLSYTSPSGLLIRLLNNSSAKATSLNIYSQGQVIFCRIDPVYSAAPIQLPRSPLVKKYKSPVLVEMTGIRPPFQVGTWTTSNGVHDIEMITKQPIGKTIPALSFVIRQRCELQTLPTALTVPIEAKRPATSNR